MEATERIKVQQELLAMPQDKLALRIDRALSFVERWERQLVKEPDNRSLRAALKEITVALLDSDNGEVET